MRPPLRVTLSLLLALALSSGSPAEAAESRQRQSRSRVAPGSGWLSVHTGLTFGDTVSLDNLAVLTAADNPGAVFGITCHYRTTKLDLGFTLEHLGSFWFDALERVSRSGGQLRVAADLRWRYLDERWGALFIRVSPGMMVFSHSDELRFQVAELAGSELDATDAHGVGFSLGFGFGLLIYLSDRVALSAQLDLVTGSTILATSGGNVDYTMIRGLFALGMEWRM